jgi:hypothetical protein
LLFCVPSQPLPFAALCLTAALNWVGKFSLPSRPFLVASHKTDRVSPDLIFLIAWKYQQVMDTKECNFVVMSKVGESILQSILEGECFYESLQ